MFVSQNKTYTTRVLVIDRDPLAASLHSAFVDATAGFIVCGHATTCRRALTLATRRRPDVVLLDLSLEGAPALLRRLRPMAVVGITSAHRLHEDITLRPLVRSFLSKPFALDAFSDRLEQSAPARCRR